MEHVDSISLGIHAGSMTWVDRHDDSWWAAFGNYDKTQSGQDHPYGETRFTQVVQMNDDFFHTTALDLTGSATRAHAAHE